MSAEDSGVPGGAIHGEHPFLPPEDQRDPVRRFRGRLPSPVLLWTAQQGGRRAGLTVSSAVVADGEPARLLGLIDEDSDLWEVVRESRRFAAQLLAWSHRPAADAFAGVAPAPGGPFQGYSWRDSPWGPVLSDVATWAGCRLADFRPMGYALLMEAEIEEIVLGDVPRPLLHTRGRYVTFG
ncbi:MAG: flavin reductase family protein [Carbonactinosporaceae bacterium]